MKKNHDQNKTTARRKFLGTATAGTAAAALSFPMISTAQSVTQMRFQSTWPSKDIFHEYAQDFVKKVNDMTAILSKPELENAEKLVSAWKPQPTALTLKAKRGITAAEEYVKAAKS